MKKVEDFAEEMMEEEAMDYVDESGEPKESEGKRSILRKTGSKVKATGKWILNHGAKIGIGAGFAAGATLGIAKILGYELVPSDIFEAATVSDVKEAVSEAMTNAAETVSEIAETEK